MGEGWGVNIHFTHAQPGEVEKIRAAGFRWVRMDFFWHVVEREKGKFDFSGYEELMKSLEANRLRPIFILDYGNDLYQKGSPRTAESRAAFCRFVSAALKRFKGRGVLWEMWNEPNIGFWQPSPNVQDYIALAKEVGRAIRREAPDEWYVGPATSGFDWSFLESCFRAGLLMDWDAVTVHPYRSSPPETVRPDWARLAALVKRYCPPKKVVPMISGEWGYSDINLKNGPDQQAQFAVRQYLNNLASGVNLSIWYDWKNDGQDPKDSEHHFGLSHSNLQPKPGYQSVSLLSSQLSGYRYVGNFNSKRMAFAKAKAVRIAQWDSDDVSVSASETPLVSPLPPILTFSTSADLKSMIESAAQAAVQRVEIFSMNSQVPAYTSPLRNGKINGFTGFSPRLEHPIRVRLTFPNAQVETLAICTAPIRFNLLPAPGGVVAYVQNQGKVAFDGILESDSSRTLLHLDPGAEIKENIRANANEVTLKEEGAIIGRLVPASMIMLGLAPFSWEAEGDDQVVAHLSHHSVELPDGSGFKDGTQLDYEFESGWKYACLKPSKTRLIAGVVRLGYWLYGDGSGNILRMRFQDSTGQTFQPDFGAIDWKGWRYVSFLLDGSAAGHWGGANDGVVHGPIHIETLVLVDSKARQTTRGRLFAVGFNLTNRD